MADTTIHYLHMTDPSQLRPKAMPDGLTVERLTPADGAVNQRFYREVGADWAWRDRLGWSLDQWRDYAERDELTTWVARLNGEPAGYAELERQADGDVELCYFGLLPAYIGRGLGGPLLAHIIQTAWALPDTRRVWVHTCTKDHPHALTNYQARGFTVYQTRTVTADRA